MKKNRHKILVLSDLKKSTSTILKSTVSLAKMVDGDIQLFYVRKPTDVVEKDNQLSAIRTINSEYRKTEKKIQSIINPISNEFGVNIQYAFTFGNIKDEILNYIKEYKPTLIVLGKNKSKAFKIIGNNVIELVLKTFDGDIMIANSNNALEPNNPISLGVLNNFDGAFNMDLSTSLIKQAQKPLKSFKIVRNSNELKEDESRLTNVDTLEYVFESSDNALKNVSKYLLKSHVNLLCLNREKQNTKQDSVINFDIKEAINKVNISMLLTRNPI